MGLFYDVLKVGNRGSEKKSFASNHTGKWKASVRLNCSFVCSEAPEAPCTDVSRNCYCISGTQDDVPHKSGESRCGSYIMALDFMDSYGVSGEMGKAGRTEKNH